MSKTKEILKEYLKGYYKHLDAFVQSKPPQSEIDKILDRINEVIEMIEELERDGK